METNMPALGLDRGGSDHTGLGHGNDTVNFGELSQLLRRRAGTIAIFVGGAMMLALTHVLFATPQFTAQGALYLGDTQTAAGQPDNSSNLGFLSDFSNQSDVETQIELITAGALIQHSILQTGLNATITPSGAPKLTYLRWKVRDHGQTSAFLPGADTLQALYATNPGKYRIVLDNGGAYTLYKRAAWLEHPQIVLRGTLGKPASGNGNQMLIEAAGPAFQFTPGRSYDLDVTSATVLAGAILSKDLSVIAGGSVAQPTKIAFLKFLWPDPYQAQAFINQLMQDYIASQLAWNTQAASTTENFVTGQLANVSASLAAADHALADYQAQTGIVDVSQNAQRGIDQVAQYETQRTALQLQQEALQQLNDQLHQASGPLNPYLLSQTNDPVLAGLTSRLSDAMVKLSQLQVQYTDSAEEVQLQEAQVGELQRSIKTIAGNDLLSVSKNLAGLDAVIAKFSGQNKKMPAELLKVVSLKRSADVLGQIYVLLMEKQEEAQVSKAATTINTRVVTPADMPLSITSPKAMVVMMFGAFAGLIAGIGLVLGRRAVSPNFESEEQVRLAVPLPVYGAVPRLPRPESGIVTRDGLGVRNPFSESFRLLRSSIQRHGEPGKPMVITIISAWQSDGKTTLAVNLAKILSEDGARVILVDGDLHLSRLPGILPAGQGLRDWLMTKEMPAIMKWPHERFDVLPAGSGGLSAEGCINEASLKPVIAALSGAYDFIIIDSPPLPTVSDGMIFGKFADLILSVVSVSHTPRQTLQVHNDLIRTLGRPHGIVINEVEPRHYGAGDAYFRQTPTKRWTSANTWLVMRRQMDRGLNLFFKR